ncbi:unnamed protein product [Ambrosiozyma monospora]|uniref:Unnamed protein product n=1 Tax=Ambrosiozyma monospora TaxID=43982 RepID=A0ACB5SZN7_AMBMO|nr:unnamed protein product [Ambrosiozyma monospora]
MKQTFLTLPLLLIVTVFSQVSQAPKDTTEVIEQPASPIKDTKPDSEIYEQNIQQDVLQATSQQIQKPKPKNIAIVGAGAGGSSAAYYLKKYAGHNVNITIFEQNDHVGGRSTTLKLDGHSIELGASIFVKDNVILYNALDEFNLFTTADHDDEDGHGDVDDDDGLGIWNGTAFEYIAFKKSKIPYAGLIKFLLHFGPRGVLKTERVRQKAVNDLRLFYDDDVNFPFEDVQFSDLLLSHINETGSELLDSVPVSSEYKSFIQAALRGIYAQTLDQIHGLGTLVGLSTSGAISVYGGNFRIFEKWIEFAEADLKLSTSVKTISKLSDGKYDVTFKTGSAGTESKEEFDYVVIAAPLGQSNVTINNVTVAQEYYETEYVPLWVSVFKSKNRLSESAYFNNEETPQTVLASSPNSPFNSIFEIYYNETTSEYIYKTHSLSPLEPGFIYSVFGETSYKFEQKWLAYPYLKPSDGELIKFELDQDAGLWYLSPFESFISTMETQALAAASIAGLISSNGGFNVTRVSVP